MKLGANLFPLSLAAKNSGCDKIVCILGAGAVGCDSLRGSP